MVNEAIKKIEAQQKEFTQKDKHYWVAEQLKDICRACPEQADLIYRDLDNPEMSIKNAEKKINEYARANGGCCPGKVADKILREFYGLALLEETPKAEPNTSSGLIDLADFM
jgi:hypothetical protein